MIGIVLAAHGPLPAALLESCDMIIGDLPQVATVSLMPGDSLGGLVDRLREAADTVDSGHGVLVFIDMFGGTPANATAMLTQQREGVRAITGVNLPMLLETFMSRQAMDDPPEHPEQALEELTATAVSAGKDSIVNVVEAFNKFRRSEERPHV